MKRIIICCDGTQNDPDQMDRDRVAPTNVVKISRAIKEVDRTENPEIRQIIYYDPGVGTGWWAKRMLEGMSGTGISENIIQAYAFLSENYQEGDEIFCFGFSRGAFTIRSLCGMINRVGLIAKEKAQKQEYYDLAYKLYRLTRPGQDRHKYFKSFKNRYMHKEEVKIKFLGVWDTVGSLGLPVFGSSTYEWNKHHDIFSSNETIEYGAQAVGIDEVRNQFRPQFLLQGMVEKEAQQKWFIGSHSNVGGGYVDAGLSDIALSWMIEQAQTRGLKFDRAYIDSHIFPDALGEMRNSHTGIYRFIGRYIRTINGQKIPIGDLHESVLERSMEVTTDYTPLNTALSNKETQQEVLKHLPKALASPTQKKIKELDKKYRNLRKEERMKRGFFGRAADNLSAGLVAFVLLWIIGVGIWVSSDYGFGITLQQWKEIMESSLILFLKLIIAPFLIFVSLLLILVVMSFIYSKIWQLRQRQKHMK